MQLDYMALLDRKRKEEAEAEAEKRVSTEKVVEIVSAILNSKDEKVNDDINNGPAIEDEINTAIPMESGPVDLPENNVSVVSTPQPVETPEIPETLETIIIEKVKEEVTVTEPLEVKKSKTQSKKNKNVDN